VEYIFRHEDIQHNQLKQKKKEKEKQKAESKKRKRKKGRNRLIDRFSVFHILLSHDKNPLTSSRWPLLATTFIECIRLERGNSFNSLNFQRSKIETFNWQTIFNLLSCQII
jgi:hypothetical protein